MNLSTSLIFLVFVVASWAVDPPLNQTTPVQDSPDDNFQPADSLVGIGVTQVPITTATPTNIKLSTPDLKSKRNTLGTGPSRIDAATKGASTTDTSSITDTSSTEENSTTETSTTETSTTETSTTETSTTESSTAETATRETSTTETSTSRTSITDDFTTSTTTVITTIVPTTTTAQPSEDDTFLALLAQNTVALTKSDFLANILNCQTSNIISDLNKQVKSLARINEIEKLMLNVTGSLAVSEADLLQSLVNSIYKVDYFGNRTINTVSYLLNFQELFSDHVNNFSTKLLGMQEQILRNSKGLDNKLSLVKQLLKQYITPRVNNLKESFVAINASQVISETELQNLPLLRNFTETSIIKVTSVLNQFAMINQTQDRSLYLLEKAVNQPEFANLENIKEHLQSISISQKRIDLAFAVCESSRSEYNANKYEPYLENYSKDYISTIDQKSSSKFV